MAKTIGIISIKGGVGKTSITSALGASLANDFGKKVLVVDANFSAPNLGLHLGLVNPEVTLHHVLNDKIDVKEAVYESEYGFHVIPGALIYSNQINPFKLKSKLKQLKKYYDVILIDSSPTLNNEILASIIASDELYAVTSPDHVTLSTTLRVLRAAKEKRNPIKGLILNKVYGKNFEIGIQEVEDTSDCKVLAVLPHELAMIEALSKSMPSSLYKNTAATREIKKLAGALIGEEYKEKGIFGKIRNLFSSPSIQEKNRLALINDEINYAD
jgi:MinD-like ATPase involved in chromosome partitioning or flagellar assembly